MVTDLSVTGRVAQMGAGVMQEVANSMVNQFADCLSTRLAPAPAAAAPPPTPTDDAPAAPAATAPPVASTAPPQQAQELKALPLLFRALGARIKAIFSR
jgi:hypothetical protein